MTTTGSVAESNRPRDKDVSRMRRIASLGLLLALSGCGNYIGNPFDGFGGFIADTHTFASNPNRPVGDGDNMRRVLGQPGTSEPLVPEEGNVWPGPLPPDRTLGDIARDPDAVLKPGDELNIGRPRQPTAATPGAYEPSGSPAVQPAPGGGLVQTPSGPATLRSNGSVQTYTDPKGATGIVVPNGNGTSTLIAPDGSVQTVPSPR